MTFRQTCPIASAWAARPSVLLLVLASLFQPAPAACGDLAKNYPAVIAEELARSVADLQAIFGAAPSACRTALAAKLNLVTLIDSLVFHSGLCAFLLFFFLAMVPARRARGLPRLRAVGGRGGRGLSGECLLFQVTAAPDTLTSWLVVPALGDGGEVDRARPRRGGRRARS